MTPFLVSALTATLISAHSPDRVCQIDDKRLTELSGLAATATGYVVVDDGSDEADHRRIFFLDARCRVVRAVAYPSRPRDTEDLALAPDGTLWVGDIGDNNENRKTVGLWRLKPGAKKPVLYRLAYPDGPHNAETLLLTPAGVPIIVTKTVGSAGLFSPAAALDEEETTPMRQVGSVSLPMTDTSNPFGLAGRMVITGGAVSPDGGHVVLRTYADAFEFEVTGGDVAKAITSGEPRAIPLPDEPQGEAITYSPDGTFLLTTTEVTGSRPADLLRYALPSRPPAVVATPAASPAAAQQPPDAHRARFSTWALATGTVLIAAAVALAVAIVRRGHSGRRGRGESRAR